MAPRLSLARATEIGGIDTEVLERIAAVRDDMFCEDGAELERERVEGARELVGGEQEWRGESNLVPLINVCCAGREIVKAERGYDGERGHWRVSPPICAREHDDRA